MRIELDAVPIAGVLAQTAAERGGTEIITIPIHRATSTDLPPSIESIVVTSDLQAIAPSWAHAGQAQLAGVAVAEQLVHLADSGRIPPLSRSGVILAGDMFSAPEANTRGASGDVTPVWDAFSTVAGWVTGVLGNHDILPSSSLRRLQRHADVTVLDTDIIERDGLRIAGVSLISGNPDKTGRRTLEDQTERITALSRRSPDIVVLHEGPPGTDHTQPGNPAIAAAIHDSFHGLTICGHVHWTRPGAAGRRYQTINVDQRVIVITSPGGANSG